MKARKRKMGTKKSNSVQSALWLLVFRKPWVLASSFFAVLTAVLLNINPILSSLRALPKEIDQTSDQFLSWYHKDNSWNGHWTNTPQGYVDQADMNLSNDDVAIDLVVKNGVIDGTISTKEICDTVPFYDFLLLRGNVSGGETASVIVWDTFWGHSQDVAKLELKRDGVVMTVVPVEGTTRLFPKEARIALNPDGPRDSSEETDAFCKGKTEAIIKAIQRHRKMD